jgi:hypothetical protein
MTTTTVTDSPDYDHLIDIDGEDALVQCPTCAAYVRIDLSERFGSHTCDCGEGRIIWG